MSQDHNKEQEYQEKAWRNALYNCPLDILEAEVIRRRDEIKRAEKPQPKEHIGAEDWKQLANLCISYIDQLAEEPAYDDYKIKGYVFEAAVEVFFGKDVWEWVKKRLQ